MVLVQLKDNLRFFDSENFSIMAGQKKAFSEKLIRDYAVRDMLLKGKIFVVEGDLVFPVRETKMLFSSTYPDYAYGVRFGLYFKQDLLMDTISWLEQDRVPAHVVEMLNEKFSEVPKIEVPKIEVPKIEVPKIEVPEIEVPKPIIYTVNQLKKLGKDELFKIVKEHELDFNLNDTKTELLEKLKKHFNI